MGGWLHERRAVGVMAGAAPVALLSSLMSRPQEESITETGATAPLATPARVPNMALLVAVIERKVDEIARLNRELGAAPERLLLLGSGQSAPVTAPFAPDEAQPAVMNPDPSPLGRWGRFWERWG